MNTIDLVAMSTASAERMAQLLVSEREARRAEIARLKGKEAPIAPKYSSEDLQELKLYVEQLAHVVSQAEQGFLRPLSVVPLLARWATDSAVASLAVPRQGDPYYTTAQENVAIAQSGYSRAYGPRSRSVLDYLARIED